MAIIEINGKDVEVDDNFHNLSEADQHATIEHIASNMDQDQPDEYYNKSGAATLGAVVGALPKISNVVGRGIKGILNIPQSSPTAPPTGNIPKSSVTVSFPDTGVPINEPWSPTHGGEQWIKGSTGVEMPGAQMAKSDLDKAKEMAQVIGRGGEFAGGEIKSGIILPPEKTLAESVAAERAALRDQQLSEIGQTAAKKYLAEKAAAAAEALANPSFAKRALDYGREATGKALTAAEPVLKVAGPILGAASAGEQYMDMLERAHHKDYLRAFTSGIGAAGSAIGAVPFFPPQIRGVGAGIGIAAPLINYGADTIYGRSGYAQGGAVAPANYLAEGDQPTDDPTLGQAASNIYKGLTDPKQWADTAEGLGRLKAAIPGVAESVVRGAAATIPGAPGDIEALGRMGINYLKPGAVSEQTALPTTRDILNKVPRFTPTHEGAQTVEDVGGFIAPGVFGVANDVAKLGKGLPVGLSLTDVSAQDAAGRLLAPKNEIGAYSPLEEAALNLKQSKGTGDQLYRMLEKEPGVKQEELQYRGLDALLKGNNDPMTREGILAHLDQNPLPKISETKLGDAYASEREPDYDTAIDNFHDDWRNAELDDDAMNAEYNYRRYDDTDWHDERKREYMEERGLDDEAFEADPAHQENVDEIIDQDAQASAEDYGPYVIHHRNHDYQIRGNNWGDIELHGPEGHIDNYRNIDEAKQAAASHALDYGHIEPEYYDDGPGSAQYGKYIGEGNGNYEEQLFHYDPKRGGQTSDYVAPHFDNESRNLLMHMRRQDAENPAGQKLLKLEEQQSDWHQNARDLRNKAIDELIKESTPKDVAEKQISADYGYKTNDPDVESKFINLRDHINQLFREKVINNHLNMFSENPEYRKAMQEYHGQNLNELEIGNEIADRMHRNTSLEEKAKELGKLEELTPLYDAYKRERTGVPDAPLKKNWNEFLMKKALYDAAKGDYDKLAWTTGKTQAERYGKMLADNVSEIHYTKTPNNRYVIAFKRPGETSYTPYENGIGEESLRDHFGEHIANQIKNNLGEAIPYITHHPEGTQALREMGTSGYHFTTPEKLESFTGFGNSPEEAKADLIKTIPRLADKHVIKGNNISFGSGKGMQGFYDKMQSDFLNKFLKKYGEKVHEDQVLGNMRPEVVNAVNITPEMRQDLLNKGFSMFKKGGLVALKK